MNTGKQKNPNKLNSASVGKSLIECSIPNELTDRINQAYETIDDAHHVTDAATMRERIKRYHSWAYELSDYL